MNRLKYFCFALLGCLALAQGALAQRSFLDVGERVDSLPQLIWLKGSPVSALHRDSTYVIELWATWCRPCVDAMPRISKMSREYAGKINFIAVNVMEEDLAKVKTFLGKNNSIMDFKVAFSGPRGSSFDKEWLRPSATTSIPRTFVIQNNTLIWVTHPSSITPEVLKLINERKFTIQAATAILKKTK